MTLTKTRSVPAQAGWIIQRNSHAGKETVQFQGAGRVHDDPRNKLVRDAVLAHIKTLRSLGRTRVTSADVADALDLNERDVRRIMLSMHEEGVKTR